MINAPAPNPPTATPVIRPLRSGNHLTSTATGTTDLTGAARNAKIMARWSFAGPNGPQKVTEQSNSISPKNDAVTEFHISKPEGLPAGSYNLEILLDGKPVSTKSFKVG